MWESIEIYIAVSLVSWCVSLVTSFFKHRAIGIVHSLLILLGVASLGVSIAMLWVQKGHAPLRTLGETRLWYSFFLSSIGFVIYKRWNVRAISGYSTAMAILFLLINALKPEVLAQPLMPALQSVWFVPHVIVYMLAYAILGLTCLISLLAIIKHRQQKQYLYLINKADNLVYVGFGFLTLGLLFGALWAKEVWGHYWTWDPKETWAFLTWAVYLIYIHFVSYRKISPNKKSIVLLVAFIVLLICWFGINYLPSAQNSVHVYSS